VHVRPVASKRKEVEMVNSLRELNRCRLPFIKK
jgi:hypothetical protein